MNEFFTDQDLEYIKETQGSLCIKDERKIYKELVPNPIKYDWYRIEAKSKTMNEIVAQ